MDVSSPTFWVHPAISSSVREEFQMTELHQTELIVIRFPKADMCQLTVCLAVASIVRLAAGGCAQPMFEIMLWVFNAGCALCFTYHAPSIMTENAVI